MTTGPRAYPTVVTARLSADDAEWLGRQLEARGIARSDLLRRLIRAHRAEVEAAQPGAA